MLLLLAFGGCREHEAEAAKGIYRDAYSLFRNQHYKEALDRAAQGLQRAGTNSDLYWNFRLLQVEILLGEREAVNARKALNFELPPKARTPRNLSRYLLCQGFIASLLQDNKEAGSRLAAA
ncbi:MAG: hypothetical protein QOJ99_2692, partial [Bryobacterales bacterium]|nr:hypothetical protein [Bryobacterales bacterium]